MTDLLLKTALALLILAHFGCAEEYTEVDYVEDMIKMTCEQNADCDSGDFYEMYKSVSECISDNKKRKDTIPDDGQYTYAPLCDAPYDFDPDNGKQYIDCLRNLPCDRMSDTVYCLGKSGYICVFPDYSCYNSLDCPDYSFCSDGICSLGIEGCTYDYECPEGFWCASSGNCYSIKEGQQCAPGPTVCDGAQRRIMVCNAYEEWKIQEDCAAQQKICVLAKCVEP
jgi:hypothetical protein